MIYARKVRWENVIRKCIIFISNTACVDNRWPHTNLYIVFVGTYTLHCRIHVQAQNEIFGGGYGESVGRIWWWIIVGAVALQLKDFFYAQLNEISVSCYKTCHEILRDI